MARLFASLVKYVAIRGLKLTTQIIGSLLMCAGFVSGIIERRMVK